MLTAIIFIIVLAVLIFVHELGHFLAARAAGIRVDAFKIGFGPKLIHWKRGETEYGINLIPFGGFVKIHGENPDEESVSGPDAARSFVNKSRWKQVMVLVAGVAFNFLFAWLLYATAFLTGVTATPQGFERYASSFTHERVMITLVAAGSPAEKAGFEIGDQITSVLGSSFAPGGGTATSYSKLVNIEMGNLSVDTVQTLIRESDGSPMIFTLVRHNAEQKISIIPQKGIVPEATSTLAIGIAMQHVGDLKLSFFAAVWEGLHYTLVMIRETAAGLYSFVANIFHGTANFSDVAGPVGIAGIVGGAARLGFTYLIMITALISINLGVINLIPFPALDGGRTLFVIIEGVIRRRIPMKFTNVVNMVGFALLMALMVVVTFKDIIKLFK